MVANSTSFLGETDTELTKWTCLSVRLSHFMQANFIGPFLLGGQCFINEIKSNYDFSFMLTGLPESKSKDL